MRRPIVIAHRGFPGLRLEHTRASYELAIASGADLLEPDLVVSADGHLVVRHENDLGDTTDVAQRPEFAKRRRVAVVDGETKTGWFAEDFTLAELKTLAVTERLPKLRPHNLGLQGQMLSFAELLELVVASGVGLCVEVKHPSYFAELGYDMEAMMLAELATAGLDGTEGVPEIVVESFDAAFMRSLAGRTPFDLVQLVDVAPDPREVVSPSGLREIASYAQGVSVHKDLILARDEHDAIARPTSLVADAHAAGLQVFTWTLRNENAFLPANLRIGDDPTAHGDAAAECRMLFDLGVDGVFSDYPSTAVEVLAGG